MADQDFIDYLESKDDGKPDYFKLRRHLINSLFGDPEKQKYSEWELRSTIKSLMGEFENDKQHGRINEIQFDVLNELLHEKVQPVYQKIISDRPERLNRMEELRLTGKSIYDDNRGNLRPYVDAGFPSADTYPGKVESRRILKFGTKKKPMYQHHIVSAEEMLSKSRNNPKRLHIIVIGLVAIIAIKFLEKHHAS